MSTFKDNGELDPDRPIIVTCLGRKGSGKSVMGLLLFESYPYDRLVIDVAGDDGPLGDDFVELKGSLEELPDRWPEHLRPHEGRRMTIRYVPDLGSPTAINDMDHLVGVAYRRGRVCILVHEIHQLAPSNKTPPHTKRVYQMSRHRQISFIGCGPRPVTVDPLQLQQSDLVYLFDLPNPDDRKRVAETIGWNPKELDHYVAELGNHEFLLFDANTKRPDSDSEPDMRLVHYPPLPADTVAVLKARRPKEVGPDGP